MTYSIQNHQSKRPESRSTILDVLSRSGKLKDIKNTDIINENENDNDNTATSYINKLNNIISNILFPGIPVYYPLKKKVQIIKSNSLLGVLWDIIQIVSTILVCSFYVVLTYYTDRYTVRSIYALDIVITILFTIDLCLNFYLHTKSYSSFFKDYIVIIDIITILPTYIGFGLGPQYIKINILRSFRIIRLIRIAENFSPLRKISSVRRQVYILVLVLIMLLYIAACLIQLMENDLRQLSLKCQYINEHTNWTPSCDPLFTSTTDDCDCKEYECRPFYFPNDNINEPSRIRCVGLLSFYSSFYFCLVTIGTVGFGDIHPLTLQGKAFTILLILATVIIMPIQISKLQTLLSLRSPYRKSYIPIATENHVIICGYVNNAAKLLRFFSEFYHPDRMISAGEDFSSVILCPSEPLEEVKALLQRPFLATKVTYIQGSALSAEDLKRVSATSASAMFFLCNVDSYNDETTWEDSSTVLRALSVSNFSPTLDCIVQVIGAEDRMILKDSDVDVILCLEQYRIALQARNAICPGFSTFIENVFHSFESVPLDIEKSTPGWYREYLHGAGMEFYFIPLSPLFLEEMRYNFRRMAIAIYAEYGKILFAVSNNDQSNIVFNPNARDLKEDYANLESFFKDFNVGMIMAEDQNEAEALAENLRDSRVIKELKRTLWLHEQDYPCRPSAKKPDTILLKPSDAMPKKGISQKLGISQMNLLGSSQKNLLATDVSSDSWYSNYNSQSFSFRQMDFYDSDEESDVTDDDNDDVDVAELHEKMTKLDDEYIGLVKKQSDSKSKYDIDVSGLISLSKGYNRNAKVSPNPNMRALKSNKPNGSLNAISEGDSSSKGPIGPSADKVYLLQQSSKLKLSFTNVNSIDSTNDLSNNQHNEPETDQNGFYVLGSRYSELKDAKKLNNHVIISGAEKDILLLLKELRKVSEGILSYHQILIVTKELSKWRDISNNYHDVYFIQGKITNLGIFTKINIDNAYSLILLGARNKNLSKDVSNESLDAPTLFAYLKISHLIPKKVYCCVELNSQANMAVLNASIMRKRIQSTLNSQENIYDDETHQQTLEELEDVQSLAETKLWEFTQTYHAFPAYAAGTLY